MAAGIFFPDGYVLLESGQKVVLGPEEDQRPARVFSAGGGTYEGMDVPFLVRFGMDPHKAPFEGNSLVLHMKTRDLPQWLTPPRQLIVRVNPGDAEFLLEQGSHLSEFDFPLVGARRLVDHLDLAAAMGRIRDLTENDWGILLFREQGK